MTYVWPRFLTVACDRRGFTYLNAGIAKYWKRVKVFWKHNDQNLSKSQMCNKSEVFLAENWPDCKLSLDFILPSWTYNICTSPCEWYQAMQGQCQLPEALISDLRPLTIKNSMISPKLAEFPALGNIIIKLWKTNTIFPYRSSLYI